MDIEQFLSAPRWAILQQIVRKPSSPTEIAIQVNTSIAYVSQQLKLLEAIGIIKKEKTRNSEKGKPRTLYYLTDEFIIFSAAINGGVVKRVLFLTEYHKQIIRIWSIQNTAHHKTINLIINALEPIIDNIKGIFYRENSKKYELILISELQKTKIESLIKPYKDFIQIVQLTKVEFTKISHDNIIPIYDPLILWGGILKGGEMNETK